LDEALVALAARQRAPEIDEAYTAYDAHPLDEPDEWDSPGVRRRAFEERGPAPRSALESTATLVERIGRLSDARMRQICGALEVAVACEGSPGGRP
jgi:hypothetical protein